MDRKATIGDVLCLLCLDSCLRECCKSVEQSNRTEKTYTFNGPKKKKYKANYNPYNPEGPKNQHMDISCAGSDIESQLADEEVIKHPNVQ